MSLERLVLVLLAALALVGFVVSPALGGPGFLTKKKANRVFLRKQVANRRFLGKSEAGTLFYSRGEADSRFLRPEGEIRINAGPTNWVLGPTLAGGNPPSTTYFVDALRLASKEEITASAQISPELPVALYGRQLKIVGSELCYDADENAVLQGAFLELVSESNGIGAPPPLTEVARDATPRTDDACRDYRAASPVPVGPEDHLIFGVVVHFPTASASSFLIGRTTFILQP